MGLEVDAAEAVIDAERQPLEVGDNTVDSLQQHVRRHDVGRLWQILASLLSLVGQPVGEDRRAVRGAGGEEAT